MVTGVAKGMRKSEAGASERPHRETRFQPLRRWLGVRIAGGLTPTSSAKSAESAERAESARVIANMEKVLCSPAELVLPRIQTIILN